MKNYIYCIFHSFKFFLRFPSNQLIKQNEIIFKKFASSEREFTKRFDDMMFRRNIFLWGWMNIFLIDLIFFII